jgi:radical SAM protein with 4Fe4S-binding SPASM domain
MGCAAGRASCSISAEGHVLPCLLHRQEVGNVRKASFNEIWFHAPLFKQVRMVKETCQFGSICSGLCPIEPMTIMNREKAAKQFVEKEHSKRSDNEYVSPLSMAPEIIPYFQIDAPGCINVQEGINSYGDCPCIAPCACIAPCGCIAP